MTGFVLIAANTVRSQAYVQAIEAAGLVPAKIILYGDHSAGNLRPMPLNPAESAPRGMFTPDFSEPVRDTVARNNWQMSELQTSQINDPSVAKCLQEMNAGLVVFSGHGGEIVSPALLNIGFDFLHVHPGRLPQYRGSTTIYYSLLNTGECFASAILLAPGIDEGPVIAEKKFPVPPKGSNIDNHYDPVIRADLLVDVLNLYMTEGALPETPHQNNGAARNYFVIHPLLKHIVIVDRL